MCPYKMLVQVTRCHHSGQEGKINKREKSREKTVRGGGRRRRRRRRGRERGRGKEGGGGGEMRVE